MGEDQDPEQVPPSAAAPDDEPEYEFDEADFADPPSAEPGPAAKPRSGWKRRTASGALLTGMALGFQQVFEEKREEPSIMMETSGTPPEDLPVEATFDGMAPRRSVVKIRPWLLGRTATTERPVDGSAARDDDADRHPDVGRGDDDLGHEGPGRHEGPGHHEGPGN